ncbi:LysE/ArgO family amino acid transporter [Nocardioides lianchengensis]|uniref:L-lysine exporter family protein LysE/ArgO n=1 Tax=Nocardioides lianchengensis TaxID=1045774 RepID=A0A1G7ABZ3_9ACTN|nr:LysE/ArgO family amino acid transporter [Nocardioides lianchengensis]NYG13638.1 L-lysine exporter family protein LysE/ArgO [Nocardioides lianchengensis]SDE12319.1 L-lysine exporter family protein LysE/ArgO [Nocardioides lianchengensis]
MLDSTAAGLATGLSLIVAIGAQNAFVLRQGLAREHVVPVVAICAVSDLLLIVAGVAGIGTVVERAPAVVEVVRWLGVAFLTWYGVRTLLGARKAAGLTAGGGRRTSLRSAVGRATALTWLNPHVYLDTVLLLGSIANTHGSDGRWGFAAGAGAASLLWFSGLGFGARLLSPLLARPRAWQVLDVLIGVTMLAIAVSLALG